MIMLAFKLKNSRFFTILTKINNLWEKLISSLSIFAVILMLFCTIIEITARNLFKTSFIWTNDLAVFSFIWIAFLGASIAVRTDEHFVIDVFPESWKKKQGFHLSLKFLSIFLEILIGWVLFYYGAEFVKMAISRMSYALGIRDKAKLCCYCNSPIWYTNNFSGT